LPSDEDKNSAAIAALIVLGLQVTAVLGQNYDVVKTNGDIAVVVNSKNPVSNLTMPALRKLFAGETRTWPGGATVKLIIRAQGAHEREVVLQLLHFSEDEYGRYWINQAYRGEGVEPVAVFSNGMQKEAVIGISGTIAFVDARDVKPGVKVLKIEGKMPGEDGYPLH
jgi:ABC-type phosphate transport system substrate-binding protein